MTLGIAGKRAIVIKASTCIYEHFTVQILKFLKFIQLNTDTLLPRLLGGDS